ncbi:MAG TPA: hypothetical protein VMT85_17575 [Thermoanaerobaculia bacterium]|nr:hypothetical protein [Thermoanaerobaculia bacterium]
MHWRCPLFLLLGHPHDPCCEAVRRELERRERKAVLTADPMAAPARFSWRLSNSGSEIRFEIRDACYSNDELEGVLVRSSGYVEPTGWRPEDLAYMQAESQAALLAWLWSLSCPVVNLYPAFVWYSPRAPLVSWLPLLRRSGLPAPPTLITNVDREARAFGAASGNGDGGIVYSPLATETRYLIGQGDDWRGIEAIARVVPVCLSPPHGAVEVVQVVGEATFWEREPAPAAIALEPALCRFAAAAGLSFVELVLAPVAGRLVVVAVEPQPRLERLAPGQRRAVANHLVDLLTDSRWRDAPAEPRRTVS